MVALNDVIEAVKSDLEVSIKEKNAVIESADLPVLNGVRFQLQQLFLNLIGNALKFSKADVPPHISISYQVVKRDTLKNVSSDWQKDYHQFVISDNGIGFEPEFKEKIFEVFQRLHGKAEYSGTGIGLSLCKKIVENHHGFISAEAELDKGATFYVSIPTSNG
jgi:light-regulated signal transduction histidine kinase (bacteriophytochrome)